MSQALRPHELPHVLQGTPESVAILSLDCFDTLIWRNTHAPADVFMDIGERGGSAQQRRWAESNARSHAMVERASSEVGIAEIYAMLMPNASDEIRAEAVAAELAAEARHCFAFRPTVELIRDAKARGKQVIIVSDTYLDRAQLAALIGQAAGEEVVALIDRIFCSSEYGVSKGGGLFRHVLRELDVPAEAILHIGDNRRADFDAPGQLGIRALHLAQFTEATEQRLRLEAAVGSVLHAGGRRPAFQPHRAQLALAEPGIGDPAVALGHSVLGPLFHAFDAWLREEVRSLGALAAGKVRLLFLMRDGHLPLQIFEAGGPEPGARASEAEISRFTALAASLRSRCDIDRFVERELGTGELERIAGQLLFTRAERAALDGAPHAARGQRLGTFLANVRKPANIDKVLRRSAEFRARLVEHVRAACAPEPGDTLVLVDLGYNGTVQNLIEPVLREALQVQVAGRYLLLREQEISGFDKKGFLDDRHYDMAALEALCGSVAVIEQLSTIARGSVIDYTKSGEPLRSGQAVKSRQSATRHLVQQGCVRFAREAHQAMHRRPVSDHSASRREAAAATLARFMFLPLPAELSVLEQFEHDVNLGGGETVALFDPAIAETELQRNGLFYLSNADRMYLPAELCGHGLPLSLALLAQRRFALGLTRADFLPAALELPILVADGREVGVQTVSAAKTHDGYHAALIPVGDFAYAIGIQFGRLFEWVEVKSVEFRPLAAFRDDAPAEKRRRSAIPGRPFWEGMEAVSDTLARCTEETGFMMIPPPGPPPGEPMVLNVVFRPIVARRHDQSTGAQPSEAGAEA